MKKIFLMIGLVALQHTVMAGCSSEAASNMNIKNNTSHAFSISCDLGAGTYTLAAGENHIMKGSSDGCNYTFQSMTCTYKNQDNSQDAGTLMLNFNSCTNVSYGVTEPSKSTSPFNCPASPNITTVPNQISYCSGFQTKGVTTYTIDSYFVLAPITTYQLEWNNIIMNLAKGQVMATKLASQLMANKKIINPTRTAALYDGKKITLSVGVLPDSPYEDNTCSAVNTTSS